MADIEICNSPLAKYRYRRRLSHLQKADCDFFVTFRTARRTLPPAARDLVMGHCLREGGIAESSAFAGGGARATLLPRIQLYAIVVMPDHLHLLLRPLRDPGGWPYPLVDILQCCKSATAHRINQCLHASGPVWEEESFDHVLRSDESLKEKAEYIQLNPVRRGLVTRPEDYPWLWVDASLLNCKHLAGGGAAPHTHSRTKGKSQVDFSTWLLFMPATTYSPTHFRVQYNRPGGA